MSTLKVGSRGKEVASLQLLLNSKVLPHPHLSVDGDFGPKTEAAVIKFQQSHQLVPDGIVGPKTWAALGQQAPISVSPSLGGGGAPWMKIAYAELGVHENSLPGHHNSRILEYHAATSLKANTDEVPWCASFVNWVLKQAGYSRTNSALAASWLNYGTPLSNGQYGAICVIRKAGGGQPDFHTGSSTGYHVGFYLSSTPTYVRLLGGNQGNRVKESNFFLSSYKVVGYRRPQ